MRTDARAGARCFLFWGVFLLAFSTVWSIAGSPSRALAAGIPGAAEQPASATTTAGPERRLWDPFSWKWVPTDEEVLKYRRSWNPMSNGPILNTGIDIQPKGQFLVQPFVFGEFGHLRFGNSLTTKGTNSPQHIQALNPQYIFAYGITDWLEFNITSPLLGGNFVWFQSKPPSGPGPNGQTVSRVGAGDTTLYLKNRVVVQDPDSWRPTFTMFHEVVLPTSQWLGTKGIPGGFSPLGRLPATKFGGLSQTEGLMFRKNLKPFRFNAAGYYTYTYPGSNAGMATYIGDIINARFIVEYFPSERLAQKYGFGLSAEFVGLWQVPYRLDGHNINIPTVPGTNRHGLQLYGVEPAVQFKLFQTDTGALVGAAGVLFSIAGQNDIDAIYPNLSLYYFWSKKGQKVRMR